MFVTRGHIGCVYHVVSRLWCLSHGVTLVVFVTWVCIVGVYHVVSPRWCLLPGVTLVVFVSHYKDMWLDDCRRHSEYVCVRPNNCCLSVLCLYSGRCVIKPRTCLPPCRVTEDRAGWRVSLHPENRTYDVQLCQLARRPADVMGRQPTSAMVAPVRKLPTWIPFTGHLFPSCSSQFLLVFLCCPTHDVFCFQRYSTSSIHSSPFSFLPGYSCSDCYVLVSVC